MLPEWLGTRTWSCVVAVPKRAEVEARASVVPAGPEQALAYAAMLAAEPGISQAEIARRFGVSRVAVTQGLRRLRSGRWR